MFTWRVCLFAVADVRKREWSVRSKEHLKWKRVRNKRKNSSDDDDGDNDHDDYQADESILNTEHSETIT